ncbi:hypothetical protein DFR49_0947 [Hephaestia caeni]|uniref:Uncharacterized protein n=1 Tax=Hephaestia caeni TaxID=645617 RepID=A0A397PA04_9SPHN|nr:hypothetical protein [Hephaestia caeni]RIA46406.1 hypothetical protein DFR49_0947 [Hephaestia caeni]
MKDCGLFAERDPERAQRILQALERYAERRECFISALDFDALDRSTAERILHDDTAIDETLAFGDLYLQHLYAFEDQPTEGD